VFSSSELLVMMAKSFTFSATSMSSWYYPVVLSTEAEPFIDSSICRKLSITLTARKPVL